MTRKTGHSETSIDTIRRFSDSPILPVVSSFLYIFSFPNFNLSWLAWIALVPLILSLRLSVPLSLRRSFFTGWLSGTLAYAGILYWIVVTFQAAHLSLGLAVLCLLLLSAYLGLFWGAWSVFLSYCFFWACQKKQPSASFSTAKRCTVVSIFAAAGWVALEYLRTYLFSGFPWALLADSQVRNLPIIQIASVTGAYGVSFLVVMINTTIAIALERHPLRPLAGDATQPASAGRLADPWIPRQRPRGMTTALPTVLLCLCYLFGIFRLHHPIAQFPNRALTVSLLQGNIDQYKKWDKAYVDEIKSTYAGLVQEATAKKPDLIVWPETSVPGYLLQDPSLRDWLLVLARHSQISQLIGTPIMNGKDAYNSAFSINREGHLEGEYDKSHLVPFGEVVPGSAFLGRYIKVLNDLGGFKAGQRSPVLQAGGIPIGVNICYEAIFPNLVRKSVKAGAQVIANLTNDGWYMKTAAPYQHWAPNVFRAVENHRFVVRADNTGISGIIDPAGRVVATSPIFESAVISGTVQPLSNLTFYTRFGDLFAWACCLFAFLAVSL